MGDIVIVLEEWNRIFEIIQRWFKKNMPEKEVIRFKYGIDFERNFHLLESTHLIIVDYRVPYSREDSGDEFYSINLIDHMRANLESISVMMMSDVDEKTVENIYLAKSNCDEQWNYFIAKTINSNKMSRRLAAALL